MDQILLKNSVVQMKNLYINHKQEYLRQHPDRYETVKGYLNDGVIKGHFQQNRTIGVKLSRTTGLTKFLTFDVDYADDLDRAKEVAEEIIGFLNSYYSIPLDKIHCHFSGSKGYHVTLFFDETIQDRGLIPLYVEVLKELDLPERKVEFRASSQYGVKLPLGIHQGTGNFMNYMRYDVVAEMIFPMSKEESFEYFLDIEPINLKDFREYVLNDLRGQTLIPASFSHEKGEEFTQLVDEINFEGKTKEEIYDEVKTVIESNHLVFGGTRNKLTYYSSIFLKEQGWDEEDTVNQISSFISNTFSNPETRSLIDEDTTLEFALSEVKRITRNTFEKDYKFGDRASKPRKIKISKEEVLEILSIKKWHLKKLLFSMLVHEKKYAKAEDDGQFYMAYSVMTKMGNTPERIDLKKYVEELEKIKKIQTLADNEISERICNRIEHSVYKTKTNVYKVTLDSSELPSEEYIELDVNSKTTLEEVTSQLLDKATTRSLLPRRQWENHFRDLYVS